mmetsp:Transcript_8771/g.25259  ORF Transcript_8771/g.25259 Transcript_8771/m.25259 type:complete len:206 (+) Transcript_8771:3274-3891(+)
MARWGRYSPRATLTPASSTSSSGRRQGRCSSARSACGGSGRRASASRLLSPPVALQTPTAPSRRSPGAWMWCPSPRTRPAPSMAGRQSHKTKRQGGDRWWRPSCCCPAWCQRSRSSWPPRWHPHRRPLAPPSPTVSASRTPPACCRRSLSASVIPVALCFPGSVAAQCLSSPATAPLSTGRWWPTAPACSPSRTCTFTPPASLPR